MDRTNRFWRIVLIALAGLFFFGVVQLIAMRFSTGEFFPDYSSYRADPMGVKALFESLERVPGLVVSRNVEDESRIVSGDGVTIIYAGLPVRIGDGIPEESFDHIERLAREGARIVFAFSAVDTRRGWAEWFDLEIDEPDESGDDSDTEIDTNGGSDSDGEDEGDVSADADADADSADDDAEDDETAEQVMRWMEKRQSMKQRWNIGVSVRNEDLQFAKANRVRGPESLPETLPWHDAVVFELPESPLWARLEPESSVPEPFRGLLLWWDNVFRGNWRTIYTCEREPVVVSRAFGDGAIVLASDTYLLSNEALFADRHPEFAAWLVGENTHVWFDETHHGIVRRYGIMMLVWKYHLHGVVIAAIVLVILFVWRSVAPFVPQRREQEASDRAALGRGAAAAFTNLVRRSISSRRLLDACVDEFARMHAGSGRHPDLAPELRAVAHTAPDPVSGYQAIARKIAERKM